MDTKTFMAGLRALLDAYDGSGGTIDNSGREVPENFVAIRPTGPRGAGKVRIWPKPYRVEGQAPQDGEIWWAYLQRCQGMRNPWTGELCFQPGRNAPEVPGFNPYSSVNGLAEMADRATYAMDWMSEEDAAKEDAATARDTRDGNRFSGGPA